MAQQLMQWALTLDRAHLTSIEQIANSSRSTTDLAQDGADGGALSGIAESSTGSKVPPPTTRNDPGLAPIAAQWPTLPEATKAR